MILDQEKITRIKRLLKVRPKGLTISDISYNLKINRNSVAKYLEILLITGQVEMKMYGNAKVYYLSHRVPISSMLRFANELILVLDEDMNVVEANENFFSYFPAKKEDLIGNPISTSPINTADDFHIEDLARDAIESGEISREISIIQGNGTKYLHVKVVPSVFDNGTKGTTFIFEDITEKKEAEQALLVKNFALASSLNGIGIADLSGNITYVNASFLQMFGYDDENEVLGKPIHIFAHEHDTKIPIILDAVRDQGGWSGEAVGWKRDGSQFHAIITASMVRDSSGIPICQMTSVLDITELKSHKEELQLKDTAMASLISPIAIFNRESNLIYANDSFLTEFELTEGEIKGKQPRDLFMQFVSLAPPYEEIEARLKDEGKWNGELRITSRDGRQQYFVASFHRAVDDRGNLMSTLASFVNITELKSIETALKSAKQNLSETIEFMPDPTFIINRDHQVIAWNRALELMTGVKREEVIGKEDLEEVFSFFQKERPILVNIIDIPPHELARKYPNVKRYGDSIFVEAFIPSMNDGNGAYLWGKASSLVDNEGNIIGAIESIRDISAWKRARESLRKVDAGETSPRSAIPDIY